MGINGLLQILKPITDNINIRQYANQKVAIDAYVWLHRGAYQCSRELVMQLHTTKYIDFCVKRIQLLIDNNVTPIMVFDGSRLPAKLSTEQSRATSKYKNKQMALILWNEGNKNEAMKYFQKAVNVTTKMAYELIKKCQELNIEYIVAPYEADSQLAYLARTNEVAAVISEDSDLLVFGCPVVLYKMDNYGQCNEICLKNISMLSTTHAGYNFKLWNLSMFRYMCILAGCDYLKSLPKIGLKRAYALINMHSNKNQLVIDESHNTNICYFTQANNKDNDKYINLPALMQFIAKDQRYKYTNEYYQQFIIANMIFKYQYIYDYKLQIIKHLQPLSSATTTMDSNILNKLYKSLGIKYDDKLARQICTGVIDPETYEINEKIYQYEQKRYLLQQNSCYQFIKKNNKKQLTTLNENQKKKKIFILPQMINNNKKQKMK